MLNAKLWDRNRTYPLRSSDSSTKKLTVIVFIQTSTILYCMYCTAFSTMGRYHFIEIQHVRCEQGKLDNLVSWKWECVARFLAYFSLGIQPTWAPDKQAKFVLLKDSFSRKKTKQSRNTATLKWRCQENFGFFHERNPPGPLINRLKWFCLMIRFRGDIP